jgi:hypothetical protein
MLKVQLSLTDLIPQQNDSLFCFPTESIKQCQKMPTKKWKRQCGCHNNEYCCRKYDNNYSH